MKKNRNNTGVIIEGIDYLIGEDVCFNEQTEYKGKIGSITDIILDSNKITDDIRLDIYIAFNDMNISTTPDKVIPLKYLF